MRKKKGGPGIIHCKYCGCIKILNPLKNVQMKKWLQKHQGTADASGRCLLGPKRADLSEQTGLFLKAQAL